MRLLSQIAEDRRSQREGLLAQGFWALLVYRISHRRLSCRYRLVRKPWWLLNALAQKFVEFSCGITLPETATIGRRLQIEHYGAIILHGGVVIGDDCLIRQGVTIGNAGRNAPQGAPKLGNRVEIGAGAKLIGAITVGDDAVIGANAVVISDLPAGCLAVGVPAVIKRARSDPP